MGEENHDLWRVFLQILPKLHFISAPSSEVHFTYCFPSQVVGSNPGVLGIFSCFPASRSWARSSPSPYFFAIRVSRKISRCLAGVLLPLQMYNLAYFRPSEFTTQIWGPRKRSLRHKRKIDSFWKNAESRSAKNPKMGPFRLRKDFPKLKTTKKSKKNPLVNWRKKCR